MQKRILQYGHFHCSCTSPARIAELQKLRARHLLARGEREAARAAMAAAADNNAAHWSRNASKHAEREELAEAASAFERALELLRMDDAPRDEFRCAEKSAREARSRVGSRLTEGCASCENARRRRFSRSWARWFGSATRRRCCRRGGGYCGAR